MPKVSIYLSDELYQQAKARELPLSSLAQQAIAQALATSRIQEWVASVRSRSPRHHRPIDTTALLAQARQEFGE